MLTTKRQKSSPLLILNCSLALKWLVFFVKHDIKPYIKQPNRFFQISGIIVIWWTKHLAGPRLHSIHGPPTPILRLAREPSETVGILKTHHCNVHKP